MAVKDMRNYIPSDLLKKESSYRKREIMNLSAIYMGRNCITRFVPVGLVPVLIHDAYRPSNIMITNPSPLGFGGNPAFSGFVTNQVGVVANGNSWAAPVGVGNFMQMHLFLEITAIAAGTTWSFYNEVQNPMTLNWADSQALLAGVTPAIVATWTNANFYATPITFGIGVQFALRWTLDAGAGAISFSVSYTLKMSLAGSSAGISQVVYIGSNNGVTPTHGYPILENSEKVFQVDEGDQIWGVGLSPVVLRVIELT
jgi:hypothetical protein